MSTFVLLVIILGTLIFIHELGHFLMAKKNGIYIYEFSLGMGPAIFTKVGKDKIKYSLRAFPIGGSVQIAGEVFEDDQKIPKSKFMCNKKWYQRFEVMVAGVTCNFLLAFIILFISSLIWGSTTLKPIVGTVSTEHPAYKAGIESGDTIISINNKHVQTWDKAVIIFNLKDADNYYDFKVKKKDGTIKDYEVKPIIYKNDDGTESKTFGIGVDTTIHRGFFHSIGYGIAKIYSVISSMTTIIANLFTGHLSLNALSGPVGIYSVVGESAKYGLESVLYLMAYLSINLGFINLLPFPAFDGGRVLFLLIEVLRGKPINSKIENTFHTIGFFLLMLLMLYITFQDIIKLF